MKVGVDLDGVCYGFTEAFCEYVGGDPTKATRWEFFEDMGFTVDGFLRTCRNAVEQGRLFKKGHLLPGTKEAFDSLIAMGHTIHIVTDRCSLDPDDTALIIQYTKDWLDDNGLRYHSIHFTGDKATIAKELELNFFIDDRVENIRDLHPVCKAFLLEKPWNRWAPVQLRTVMDWHEFLEEIRRADWDNFVVNPSFEQSTTCWAEEPTRQIQYEDGSWSREEVRVTSETGGQKGQKMARIGSLDPQALMEVAKVAGFGEQKYDRLNYLKGYDWSLSYDACQRHLHAFWSGQDLDPESGLPHLAHAAWHCLAMMAFMKHELGTDDRYKPEEDAA